MIRSGYVILLLELVVLSRGQDCPRHGFYNITQFGSSCQYRCRCVNEEQCDKETGRCTNGCASGWMGPGCQYRNLVALNNTNVLSNGNSNTTSLTVDGDTTTCTTISAIDSQPPFWRVDLPRAYYVAGLIIKVNTETTFNFRVEGSNSSDFNTNTLCYQHQNSLVPTEFEIMCLEVITVKHIFIIGSTISQTLELCEVEIYGGRFISFKGSVTQSSNFSGWPLAIAEAAVDGRPMREDDPQETGASLTCAVTEIGMNSYWQLIFPTEMRVQGIFLYGRRLPDNPEYNDQIAGFMYRAIFSNELHTLIYADNPQGNSWEDYQPRIIEQAVTSKGVFIFIPSTNARLSLCEVEVFAECEPGQCGWNCSDVCNCSTIATGSYRKDGRCPYGCVHRWTGQNGNCDQTCPNNTWGTNCSSTCFCSAGSQCNIDNGTCPGECVVGWKGQACNTTCDNNMYGQNCKERCGRCANGTQCDHVSGHCIGVCEPGWQNTLCNEQCPDMYYGPGCSESCGKCFNSALCNKTNGHCVSCESGYKRDLCKQNCTDRHFGYNCNETCGHCKDNTPCDIYFGHCQGGCQPGWQEPLCKTECSDMLYGQDCAQRCGKCLNSTPCDKANGNCISCDKGYTGSLCQQVCSGMMFGYNCNETCGRCKDGLSCNNVSGECPGDCEPGLQLPLCKYECPDMNYGTNCSQMCGQCLNSAPCDKVSGSCIICDSGYQGTLCQQQCKEMTYGYNCSEICGHCKNNASCDPVNGHCPGDCEPGFEMPLCKYECPDMNYGTNCSQMCGKCLNSAPCNKVSGSCITCDSGYQGTLCQQQCIELTYGYNCSEICGHCKNNESCDPVNGHCTEYCEPGFEMPLCKYDCDDGDYGVNCNSSCGFCIDNEPCDKVTGNCTSCSAGYEGTFCMTPCSGKQFGPDCFDTCGSCINNTVCSTKNGHCPLGCESGYSGPRCMTASTQKDDDTDGGGSFPIGVVIGVLAGLIVVAAVALGLFIFIRRRSSNPNIPTLFFGKSDIDDKKQLRGIPLNENLTKDTFSEPVETRIEPTYEDVNEDHIYMNRELLSKPISVSTLKAFCQNIKYDPSLLAGDFELLPTGRQFATTKALKHTNMRKNRYKDLYPYDKNAVSLPLIPGIEDSDFISASYINGFEKPKRYIASQGAMKDTVNDTWRMIWSHNIATVVMLTRCYELGKLKCEQYWPEEGSMQYGDITVKTQLTDEYAEYTIRTFELQKNGTSEIKHTKQYHFTGWPDKDVPDDTLSLVQFLRIVKQSELAAASPWMVHCSAGIGRTGTFIALDYLYDQGKATNTVDVKQCVHELRDQRVNMVQTKDQYEFVHQAVQEALNPVGTAFQVDEFHTKWTSLAASNGSDEKGQLFEEYKAISEESMDKQDDSEYVYGSFNTNFSKYDFSESLKPENTEKSRTLTILPQDKNRPILASSAKYQSNYINAVFMSMYRKKNGLVLNQLPLQCTVIDTVRMIWQYNMRTIIIMEHTVPKESRYWPDTEANVMNIGIFAVELVSEESNGGVITRMIKIKLDTEVREIVQFHYQLWSDSSTVPENSSSILRLVTDADTMMRKLGSDCPLLVQCLDGATRSGLFCIMWSILERIQSTNTVAIAETVRLAKVRRKQVIPNYEQYRFCWETIREQIESADVYGNVI